MLAARAQEATRWVQKAEPIALAMQKHGYTAHSLALHRRLHRRLHRCCFQARTQPPPVSAVPMLLLCPSSGFAAARSSPHRLATLRRAATPLTTLGMGRVPIPRSEDQTAAAGASMPRGPSPHSSTQLAPTPRPQPSPRGCTRGSLQCLQQCGVQRGPWRRPSMRLSVAAAHASSTTLAAQQCTPPMHSQRPRLRRSVH